MTIFEVRCPGCGDASCQWKRLECESPVPPLEEWRPAPRLEGYEVSSLGRMRSWRNRRGWPLEEPVIVGHVNGDGYMVHSPTHGGRQVRVYRLVCEAWHGPAPEGKPMVRHLDDDPSNNVPANLAWGDAGDNARDRSRNGNSRSPRNGTLTHEQVREIRRRRADGESGPAIARDFGVTSGTVYHIMSGHTWRHVL